MTCQDIADLLNAASGKNFGESSYRKKYKWFMAGREYERTHLSDQTLLLQLQEIKKEKIKLSDERTEINKKLRSEARLEAKFDYIEKVLVQKGIEKFDILPPPSIVGENDLLVCLSDLHIGATYYGPFGNYDSDIAQQRLTKYLYNVIEIGKQQRSENCYVGLLGDCISGDIHRNLSVSNRENVIDQLKIAIDLVENFLYELSKHFKNVYMASVSGNHSRLGSKEESSKDVRLDSFIPFCVSKSLKHIKNIKIIKNNIDSTIGNLQIRGKSYLLVHGDFDPFTKSGVSNLVMMLGEKPYAVVYGHKHQCSYDDVDGVKMVRSGSLCGSGDEFTISNRLYGKPNQMICVCANQGITTCYPVEL